MANLTSIATSSAQAPTMPIPGEMDLAELPQLLGRFDPTILDIGANNGGHTRAFFDLFPLGNIHAFEPDPRCIAKFKQNLALYPRAKLHEMAIGATDGTATFHASGGQNLAVGYTMPEGWDMSGSLRKPKEHLKASPGITFDHSFDVQVVKLDTWVAQNNIDTIDFIWADVQGAEGDLIDGGEKTFAHKVRFLYTEYSNREMYEGQITLEQIMKKLPGFEILRLYEYDVLLKNTQV